MLFALERVRTRVEELALDLRERRRRRAPLDRRRQPLPAVQVARIPARRDPGRGGRRDVPVQTQAGSVLVDPASQRRPFADQRLVCDLHVVFVDDDADYRVDEVSDGCGCLPLVGFLSAR